MLGVVFAPALKEIYFSKKGSGAWKASVDRGCSFSASEKRRLSSSLEEKTSVHKEEEELVVVASKSHLNEDTKEFIDSLEEDGRRVSRILKGSSLKLLR